MTRAWPIACAALLTVSLAPCDAFAQRAVQVISIEGHRKRFDSPAQDAIARYFLVDVTSSDWDGDGNSDTTPLQPIAVLATFTGGFGTLHLTPQTVQLGSPGPFESVRYQLAAEGFVVAAVDAASDFLAHTHPQTNNRDGMDHASGLAGHQLPGRLYADSYKRDLEAVVADLRRRFPGLPVFAVGLSLGTVSAFVAATELNLSVDGIVLASPNTGPRNTNGDLGPSNPNLDRVRVPALVIAHQEDPCPQTQPANAETLAKAFTRSPRSDYLLLTGGFTGFGNDTGNSTSRGCNGLNAHNFFGIESELVRRVTTWIKEVVSQR